MRHPGITLGAMLSAVLKQKEFGRAIGAKESHVSEVLAGKRMFTTMQCLRMEQVFHVGKDFWLKQSEYRYWCAENNVHLDETKR